MIDSGRFPLWCIILWQFAQKGDEVKAAMVFGMCSWESPGAILDQWDKDDEEALNNERANYNG